MSETTVTPAVQNPALTRLVDVVQSARVEDMNYIFNYTRVKNPDKEQLHILLTWRCVFHLFFQTNMMQAVESGSNQDGWYDAEGFFKELSQETVEEQGLKKHAYHQIGDCSSFARPIDGLASFLHCKIEPGSE
jgi:hypothetical protein